MRVQYASILGELKAQFSPSYCFKKRRAVMDTFGPSNHSDYQSILNSITDGVLTVNRNMLITSFNRAAEEITQVKHKEAIGRHCFEVMRAEVCESACPMKKTFR